jgi:hypothetical protein
MRHSILLSLMFMGAALAPVAVRAAPVAAAQADQARDHASILAMAGTFKVTFDFRETVSFQPGYTLYPAKLSGGHEVVRVIADRPDFVSLQHLLVVEDENKKPVVVKHWRQDWAWQPKTVLTYVSQGQWKLAPVSEADRRGAWSQTVWQTDDSPRYGGVGRWRYDAGVARWTSDETLRPLARRDATRNPPYDHYAGTNRHALTPNGWVHEQDNAKIGTLDGKQVTFAHETVLNSYVPATDFPIAAADDYWAKTREYWATIRQAWDKAIARDQGLKLEEQADAGSATGHELMLIADDIASGEIKVDAAKTEGLAAIAKEIGK